jgi:hypothetical protein
MDLTINWLTELWSTFSLWTSTQPTFVRLLYRFVYISVSGLFVGRGRPKVKRDFKPPNRAKKDVIMDDDAPPFLFR